MKKTILVIVLALLAAAGSSLRLSLNIDESHIRCSPASDGRILLDINIGELFTDPDASVKLPAGFDPYLSLHAQIPVLNFHIAIGNDGEYRANITGHQIQTEIPYQDGRSHGSQNVFISKPYRLRDIRGIDLMVYPYSSVDGKLMISDKLRVEFIRQEGAAS
ncbi:MAG: hypothetical protein U1B83_03775, partial [Candidatus Cloacimonadaceae bacterium]|nr:hypothetical protein [Candidatus Cloacimonadaceae bacterium]